MNENRKNGTTKITNRNEIVREATEFYKISYSDTDQIDRGQRGCPSKITTEDSQILSFLRGEVLKIPDTLKIGRVTWPDAVDNKTLEIMARAIAPL